MHRGTGERCGQAGLGNAECFGAGIKGKVLESFAAQVPCVMTPVAVEGLPLTPGVRRLVADNPDGIAELICLLHADAGANTEAAQAGLGLLAKNFTADHVRRDLSAALARTGLRVDRGTQLREA